MLTDVRDIVDSSIRDVDVRDRSMMSSDDAALMLVA